MPGLREQVVLIICQEWPKGDIALNPATISGRLQQSAGYSSATEAEVRLELEHLTDHGFITTSVVPDGTTDPTVTSVRPDLCA
jgi:hypothetical protein